METQGPGQDAGRDRQKWVVFAVLAVGLFVEVMDFGMVGVALPSIADDFDLPLASAAWVILSTALTLAAVLLPVGALSDAIGRKRTYVIGAVFFGVGSLISLIAPSLGPLVAGRVIAAIGAAMRMATGFAIVATVFPPEERGKGLGATTSVVGFAAITGPIVGGVLVDAFGWRSIFIYQGVGSLLVLIPALFILDPARVDAGRRQLHGRFDFFGAALSAVGFVVLILVMNSGGSVGWTSPLILGGAAGTVMIVAVFIRHELRTPQPMFDLRVFMNTRFSWAISARFLGFLPGSAYIFLMPFYLQDVQGYGPSQVGLVMFPGAAGMAVMAGVSGQLSDKFGVRPFVVSGLVLVTGSVIVLATLHESSSVWLIMLTLLVQSLGMGLWISPNAAATMSAVEPAAFGVVAAFLNLVRTVANVTSVALASAVVSGAIVASGFEPDLSEIVDDATGGMAAAFVLGARYVYLTLAVAGVAAIVAALKMKEPERAAPPAGLDQGSAPRAIGGGRAD